MVHSCFAHNLGRRFAHLAVVTLVHRCFKETLTWLAKVVLNAAKDCVVDSVAVRGGTVVHNVPIHARIAVGTCSAGSHAICMKFLLVGHSRP